MSESPYFKSFSEISKLHSDISKEELTFKLKSINMDLIYQDEIRLPNKKVFLRLDYKKAG